VSVRQLLRFDAPSAAHGAENLAPREAVDALAHARAGRVFGRGDVAVVAVIVLDAEMPVRRHREHELGEPALERRGLVVKFVTRVDPRVRCEASAVSGGEKCPHGRLLRRRPPGAANQRHEVQGYGRHRQPAIKAVRLELRHVRLGWVVLVFAQSSVEQ